MSRPDLPAYLRAEAERIEAELAALGAPPLGDRHAWDRYDHREEKKINRQLVEILK